MDPRQVEDPLLSSRQYSMQQRLTEHSAGSAGGASLERGDQIAPRPSLSQASQRQVMVGDRLMIMNDAGGLDDPHGLCESIIPEHIHIKRPMNAFMCWAQIARRRLADEKPELRNTELSKILGQMWKELNKEQKTPYIKKAEQLRLQHKTQYPNYKYRPKRKRHSKYAIVPSPEVLNPPLGSSPSRSSPKPGDIKLSHPSYLCNIVKEENLALLASTSESSRGKDKATYNTLQSYGRQAMSDVLKDAAGYYHGYRYSPYYNDLTSYTREMGYYQALQQQQQQHQHHQHHNQQPPTPFPTLSTSNVQYNVNATPVSSNISSPTVTSSTIFAEESSHQDAQKQDRWTKGNHGCSIKVESRHIGQAPSLETDKATDSARLLKISNITGRMGPLEAPIHKSEVPPIASYIQFYTGQN